MSNPAMQKALQELANLRNGEQATASAHLREVYQKLPRVAEIDRALSSLGARAIKNYLADSSHNSEAVKNKLRAENEHLKSERRTLLKEAGYDDDYTDVRYHCAFCKDTGFLPADPQKPLPAGKERRCQCLKQRIIANSYDSPFVNHQIKTQNFTTFDPDRFSDLPFEDREKTPRANILNIFNELLFYAEHFPDNDPQNLFFYGAPGTGKTFLCNCLAKTILENGYSVVYMSADDLVKTLADDRFGRTPDPSLIQAIRSADLLIIDDLGTEISSQTSSSLLLSCLNNRLIRGVATVISSNMNTSDLAVQYSMRFTSRLLGNFVIRELYGPDLRVF